MSNAARYAVDAHVHLQPGFDLAHVLDRAARAMAGAVAQPVTGMLMLTMEGANPWPPDLERSVDGIFDSLETAPVAT